MVEGRFYLFVVCVLTLLISFQILVDVSSAEPALTRKQVLADAKTTEALLKKYHSNLYAHRTPKQLQSLWRKAKSQLPDKPNYLDAATLAQQMLAAVCDEHTLVTLSDSWVSSNWVYGNGEISGFFPRNLVIVGTKLYLDDIQFVKKRWEIVSINERNSGEIINFLKSITSADGCQNSDVLFTHQVVGRLITSVLLTNFLGQGSIFKAELKDAKTGATNTLSLQPVSLSVLRQRSRYRSIYGRSSPLKSIGIEAKDRDWEFAFDIIRQAMVLSNLEKSIFYIFVPSFDGAKAQVKYFDDQLRDLVKENPDHVIVDLTNNPGGWSNNAQQFLSYFLRTSSRTRMTIRSRVRNNISDANYIWHDKKHREWYSGHVGQYKRAPKRGRYYQLNVTPRSFGNKSYKGKLTVLMSPKTGSAATTVATILMRKAGAKIVGDIGDASMKSTCSSSPGAHLLPNSKAGIMVPLVCGDRHPAARRKGNLLKPDVRVDIATQNSRMTNAAILTAAINSLNLKGLAELNHSGQSGGNRANLQPKPKQGFVNYRRTIPITLAESPNRNARGRAWLGIGTANIADLDLGIPELNKQPALLISKIFEGSPADTAGLQVGDILLSVDREEIHDTEAIIKKISRYRPGKRVFLKIVRLANTTNELISILKNRLTSTENAKTSAVILGSLYLSGGFGELNRTDSVRLFEKAADAGSLSAASILGHIYNGSEKGKIFTSRTRVITPSFYRAMKYFARAAALGDKKVMFRLAQIYDFNTRVKANPELAANYMLHAYQRRNREARDILFETPHLLSKDGRIALKKILHDAGIYDGEFDDVIDADSREAIVRLRTEDVTLPELPQKFIR